VGFAGDCPVTAASSPVRPAAGNIFEKVTLTGIILVVFWIVVGVAVAAALVTTVNADRLQQYGMRLLLGIVTTIQLVVLSVGLGALLSLPIAAGRLSKNRIAAGLAYGYSYFFRGTPLLAQLFLIYYGIGQFSNELRAIGLWWLFREAFWCAIIAFTLNTAAYQAEILSGAIRNVPRGQREGAYALGLHPWATIRLVVVPQALVVALRPYGNETILMIKASSLASIVTVLDIMGQTRFIFSKTYDLSFYLWAAVFYLVMVEILSRVVNLIERRLTRHMHR